MEARTKAKSMKRSASMGRAASRSAARGKAKARAIGRARRGGDYPDGLRPGDCVKVGTFGTGGEFIELIPSDGYGEPQIVYKKNGERFQDKASKFFRCSFKRGDAEEREKRNLDKARKEQEEWLGKLQENDPMRGVDEMVGGKRRRSLKKHYKGRARRGGEDDIEMGITEQERQDAEEMKRNELSFAEEGRSPSPPNMPGHPDGRMDLMEKGRAFKKGEDNYYDPDAYKMVGGKRRRSKKFYKGKASKTRKGRKDFVTHKGDKYFHRKGQRQTKRQGKSKGLFEQLFGL